MANTVKKRLRRKHLWLQDPCCHWCGKITVLPESLPEYANGLPKHTVAHLATLDHLRPRYHEKRREPNLEGRERTVLACWKCNNERDRHDYNALSIETRHKRSHPRRLIGGLPLILSNNG